MTATRAIRRAWVLLEMLLALTIFVFTAIAVLGALSGAITGAERTRDRARAVDLARSTMAKLEAGLGTVQNLAGPVPAWEAPLTGEGGEGELGGGFADTPPEPSLWKIDIETLASEFGGLTKVTVTALKRPAPESDRIVASYSLHQLVRLAPEVSDAVGDLDDMGGVAAPGAAARSPEGGL